MKIILKRAKEKGFTIVELLVVIAIIAILATVSVVGYFSLVDKAKDSNAVTELEAIKTVMIAELSVESKTDTANVTYTLNSDGTITASTAETEATTDGKNLLSAFENLETLTGTITFNGDKLSELNPTASTPVIISKIYYSVNGGEAVWNLKTGAVEAAANETPEEENSAHIHAYVTHEAKDATCTGIGWNVYETCSGCDYTTYEEIAALGHNYDDGTVTTEATCTETGVKTYTCTVCGAIKTETVAALGHNTITHEAKAATCTGIGWNAYETCSRCDYSTYSEIPTTDHTVDDNVVCTVCGFGFTENDGTYSVYFTKAEDTSVTAVTIPSTYNGKSVTAIADPAFIGCEYLVSIEIPDSITNIGDSAFAGCTALTTITIPDSVTSIDVRAFSDCSKLTSITIPDSVTSISEGAFEACNSLKSVTIGNKVTYIGDYAFQACEELESITIPSAVKYIGKYAFSDCFKLTDVTFENTTGWWYASDSDAISGTSLSGDDLKDTATVALYLNNKYCKYYWKCG